MTTTRVLSAAAATILGSGLTLVVAGAPATAAPGVDPSMSACTTLSGGFAGDLDGWWCTYPAAGSSQLYDPALTSVCDGDEWAMVIDDGIGWVGFRCTYV